VMTVLASLVKRIVTSQRGSVSESVPVQINLTGAKAQ
jgi:hypothetical protein